MITKTLKSLTNLKTSLQGFELTNPAVTLQDKDNIKRSMPDSENHQKLVKFSVQVLPFTTLMVLNPSILR